MSDSDNTLTRAKFLDELATSWNELQTYLASLTEDQLTRPTDAAGWTAKDHVIHLAMWEKAALALIEGKSKREVLDITPEVWEQDDDPINAVLQQRYQHLPLSEVMQILNQHHDQLLQKLNSMTEADFQLPHSHYQPGSGQDMPIIRWIHWDTIHHYGEHIPWIAAIVEQA